MTETTNLPIGEPGMDSEGETGGPYRSLLVPLVLVPSMIVMVAVLIFAMFGLLSGSESSPRENLAQLLNGGANEKQQAAFGLGRQLLEFQHARNAGRDPEWAIDERFLDQLRSARAGILPPESSDEVWVPYVLSALSAELGDSEGVAELVEMMHLDDALDPEFTFRTGSIFILGSIGAELSPSDREFVARAMIAEVEGTDDGFAWLAAGALQKLPSPGTVPALEGLLGSRRADMRLQAALSLAELGVDSGVEVLLEMISEAPYLAEREVNSARWAPQTVSLTRRKVLLALQALGRLPERAVLEELARDGSDPNVRSLAIELLSGLDV